MVAPLLPQVLPTRRSGILAYRLCALVLLWLGVALSLQAQKAGKPSGELSLTQVLPLGALNREIHIPAFDESGRKSSDLRAASAVRVDDEQLLANEVLLDWHGSKPGEQMQLRLPRAFYNLVTQMVRSPQRSEVRRRDLQTSGDQLVFDSRRSTGSLVGRVRTLLFSASNQPTTPSR